MMNFFDEIRKRMERSIFLRLMLLGFLMLILQIPILEIDSTINERQMTRETAAADITNTWGGRQVIAGPVLSIPYVENWRDEKNHQHQSIRHAFFLPEKLVIKGDVKTEKRYRGIFEIPLYMASLEIEGDMGQPSFGEWPINGEILWESASLVVGIADPKAIREQISLQWNDKHLAFEPGQDGVQFLAAGIQLKIPGLRNLKGDQKHHFKMSMVLGGSNDLHFLPFGTVTDVDLKSEWPDPSFSGSYLPASREVSSAGFSAKWHVLHLARNYPDRWLNDDVKLPTLEASAFGVSFLSPVESYTASTRSVKYEILFVSLTFLVFFLFELFQKLKIHPVQYLLVGSALCIFYLLLLALSEHVGFGVAYVTASLAVIGVVFGYSLSILKKFRLAVLVAAQLAGLYAFLFVLLQIQDYALLVGSVGMLFVLAVVMYVTRKIDWYQIHASTAQTPEAA